MTGFDTSREAFCDHAAGDRPVVVAVETTLDVETTPLAAYAALSDDASHSFLLESAEKVPSSDPGGAFRPADGGADRHARYSFVGYDPEAVVTVDGDETRVDALGDGDVASLVRESVADADGDVLDRLRAGLPDVRRANLGRGGRQRLDGGLVGYVAYDAVYDLFLEEVGVEPPDSRVPDAQFVLNAATVAFDHLESRVSLSFTPLLLPGDDAAAVYDSLRAEADRVRDALADAAVPETGGFRPTGEEADPREAYEESVRRAKSHIRDGDVYQVVLSRTRDLYGDVDPLGLYESLREVNPSPYMYCLCFDGRDVVGASPETLVSVRDGEVTLNPIAGTCPRGASPVEDRRLAGEMLADEKERAEHTMLVDLARNDVRRVSAPGSVRVEEFMNVLKYSHVQHIESTVTGRLADDADAFDALRAALPAGTLSGAPKVRAMELIDDLEVRPRGLYGGGVGYVSWTGDADTAIVIRTATVEDERRVTVQAGAGIVADSDPESEYEETEQKMGAVVDALERISVAPEASR